MVDSEALIRAVGRRETHLLLESGHHGSLWLDLDRLFLDPALLAPALAHLARRLDAAAEFDAVCGPAVGGAIVGYAVAESLDRRFFLVEHGTLAVGDGLYGVEYRASAAIRDQMAGLRIAVVDDAMNAGSATRGAAKHIVDAGGQVTAIGAVFVLGDTPRRVAAELSAPLVGVLELPNQIWAPEDCPLCADGVELEEIAAT